MISLRFGTGLLAVATTLFSVCSSSAAQTMTPLYNFNSATGSLPSGSLMQADDGNFYGVTQSGGASNLGTVFQMTPAGVEKVIYSFTGHPDECPIGGLIENVDGLLYGVTSGCSSVAGTVFSISLAGAYKTVATLTSAIGAQQPVTALIAAADGTLYGATKFSATANAGGAIFKVSSTTGQVSIVYNFSEVGKSIQPSALVVASDGLLYGTTLYGGANDAGMVFRVATDGSSFKVLHSFTGILGDGSPAGGLVQAAGGLLYGISSGATVALNSLYSIATSSGAYKTIQQDLSLGTVSGLLVGADGTLYGLASGLGNLVPEVFELSPTGSLTKLVNLSIPLNLNVNLGVLALGLDGALYGTSSSGGTSGLGFAFKVTESSPLTPPINLSLSEPTITLGNTVDLIYQLENGFSNTANTCSAHGSGISGSVPSSGSLSVTPQTAGNLIYAIICDGIEAGTGSLNVLKADSTTEVASSPGTLQTGQRAEFVFQVNGNQYEPKPTGQVTVMSNGQQIAYATLDSNGQATLYISTVGYTPGSYPLTINYSGDLLYKASSTGYTLKILIDSTTTTMSISGSVIAGKPVTVSAAVRRASGISGQPTGTFAFMYNGAVIGTVAVNSVGDATLTTSTTDIAAGSYPISARYNGDTYDAMSTSTTITEVITKSSSTTSLHLSSDSVTVGQSVTVTATATRSVPNEAVSGSATFYVNGAQIGTAPFNNNVATYTYSTANAPAGTYQVSASFAGDSISTGSTSASDALRVH